MIGHLKETILAVLEASLDILTRFFLKSLVSNLFITNFLLQKFFTSDHIYGNPTAKGVYSASAFDPEGLFGTLTSIFQVK